MKDVFEIGKKSATSEMAVNVLATSQEIKSRDESTSPGDRG